MVQRKYTNYALNSMTVYIKTWENETDYDWSKFITKFMYHIKVKKTLLQAKRSKLTLMK